MVMETRIATSIEQKAQRYDEALERMKSWVRGEHPECFTEAQKAAEFIFPELKESEDEKIREALIRFHKSTIDVDGIRGEDIIAWLEKQGNTSNKATYTQEVEIGNGNIKGLVTEEIPIDKIEPKFKVGDWITNGYYTWKIIEVKPLDYILQSQDGNIVDDNISYVDEQFHSFTIEDAKDGDVLNSPSHHLIWIYKDNSHCYACVNMNYVSVNISTDGLIAIPSDACPATKDERTILFANMKKAGYEWDAEKKELKKIEPIRAWSEEDALRLEEVICMIEANGRWVRSDDAVKLVLEWLKSLKERIGDRKMKQEEIKILENVEKKIQEKEDYCFQQMSFCRKHKFEMETSALEYRRDAYHQCRLDIMDAIDKLKKL